MGQFPVSQTDIASLVYAPQWKHTEIQFESRHFNQTEMLVLVPASQTEVLQHLQKWFNGAQVIQLDIDSMDRVPTLIESGKISCIAFISVTPWRQGVDEAAIISFLRLIKVLAKFAHVRLDILTVKSICSPAIESVTHPADAVYIGIGQTAAKEFCGWDVRCCSLSEFSQENIRAALQGSFDVESGTPISLDERNWWTNTLEPKELLASAKAKGFKQGGTYLIFGATGGLGARLARYLADHYQARLILVGRRPEADELIRSLGNSASSVVYEQVDLVDAASLSGLFERHPHIDGVVHSALVLQDSALPNMTEQALISVLKPKLHGLINLVNVMRGRDFDFILLFSSIQSYIANAGQANYTAACVSKDALGSVLRDLLLINTKVINWGYWGSIGIVATPIYRERMHSLGIGSIEPEEGLTIIEALLRSDVAQISVIKASRQALERLKIKLYPQSEESVQAPAAVLEAIVPAFEYSSESVRYNMALADTLQRYTRARLGQTLIPEVVTEQHAKLAEAIRAIPRAQGPSREQMLRDFPESKGHVELLEACLAHYPQILTGEIDPLMVMFPEGSFKLVEPVYRDNPLADYFNQVVADVVERFTTLHAPRTLHILEVGSGTGSTTQFILPKLRQCNVSYTFTDLSLAFLNKARARFREFPFVRYEICDIERSVIDEQRYEVIIASNVIHATADLPATLLNVRKRLVPGGIFILNEITTCQDYATLTFGLTEGWWLSTDPYRIPNSPLVSAPTWYSLLQDAGFTAVKGHGSSDQQVIVAYLEGEPLEQSPADSPAGVSMVLAGDLLSRTQHWIRGFIAEILHAYEDEINFDQPFKEYGVDSLIALELLKPFRDYLGYLPATVLFEHPSITRLAKHFLDEHGDAVRRALDEYRPFSASLDPAVATEASVTVLAMPIPNAMPRQFLRDMLRETIASTMLMEPEEVELDIPFKEYGIDSIISLELLKPLRENFGYLPATLLFEYPTIERLATYLQQNHADAVGAFELQEQGSSAVTPEQSAVCPTVLEHDASEPAQDSRDVRADDLAVVGMAGCFPEADDIEEFWRNLLAGRDCTSSIPSQRWPLRGFENPNSPLEDGSYTVVGGFIGDVDAFDNEFFSITPLEAERMDPQERLFLQNAYHTFADAGYRRTDLRNSETGVFVGVMNGGYAWHRPSNPADPMPTSLFWSIANRVSYLYDLKGPSIAIDTACSASLTALHLACQAIRNGDCKQALVAGVNLIVNPRHYEQLCGLHMLSRSGVCRPFGSGADGFVDGEGVCSILIKPYADAVRDNDRIHGIIRGTAINSGGQANGYSAPNPEAQAQVIAKAIERAGLSAHDINYVEAHGTGTELGDPIEIRGLTSVFKDVAHGSVAIGSVKGNVGHLESAAGLTGLIKVLKQLQQRQLVASINAEQINPHLDLGSTPFQLVRQAQSLPDNRTLFASVSSFGAGGANAHAVLQSAPVSVSTIRAPQQVYIAVLSARTQAGLQREIDALYEWLEDHDPALSALSYTLCCAREHFSWREGYVFSSKAQLLELLREDLQQRRPALPQNIDSSAVVESVMNSGRLDSSQADELVRIFKTGHEIDWYRLYNQREVISLPNYGFEKTRFWVKSEQSAFHDLNEIVRQHSILGVEIAPAAWGLSHCLENSHSAILKAVLWRSVIHDLNQVRLDSEGNRLLLSSWDRSQIYFEGELGDTGSTSLSLSVVEPLECFLTHKAIYQYFRGQGYLYGPDLQVLRWAKVGRTAARAFLNVSRDWGYRLSPALLDGGLQTAILIPQLAGIGTGELLVPYHLSELRVLRQPKSEAVFCQCVLRKTVDTSRSVTFDLVFSDGEGTTLLEMRELTSIVVRKSALQVARPTLMQRDVMRSSDSSRIVAVDLD